jgi:hypothetical protein
MRRPVGRRGYARTGACRKTCEHKKTREEEAGHEADPFVIEVCVACGVDFRAFWHFDATAGKDVLRREAAAGSVDACECPRCPWGKVKAKEDRMAARYAKNLRKSKEADLRKLRENPTALQRMWEAEHDILAPDWMERAQAARAEAERKEPELVALFLAMENLQRARKRLNQMEIPYTALNVDAETLETYKERKKAFRDELDLMLAAAKAAILKTPPALVLPKARP